MILACVNAFICVCAVLRLLSYRSKTHTYRPRAALLAYLLIVAFAVLACVMLLEQMPLLPSLAQTLINAVFCLAIFATGGNVYALFSGGQNFVNWWERFLGAKTWI